MPMRVPVQAEGKNQHGHETPKMGGILNVTMKARGK
jgi:hypothetical protein